MESKRVHILATPDQLGAIDNVLLPGESRSEFIVQAALKRAKAREESATELHAAIDKVKKADDTWRS